MPLKVGLCKTNKQSKGAGRLVANGTPTVKSNKALYQENGDNSKYKSLGLDCVTCIRSMAMIFIVESPIWQFLDCSLLYLSIKATPLDSSFVITTNLERSNQGRDLWPA